MSDYSDIEEVIPPDVGGLDLGIVTAMLPTADEVYAGLWAGGGVLVGIVAGKAVEGFLLNTVRAPRFVLPFAHAALGVGLGKFAARYSAPAGVGIAGAFGALALVRALDIFFNIKVKALSGFEDSDLGDLADLLDGDGDMLPPELQGFDEMLPPELQGFDDIAVEDRGMGQVTAQESYSYAGGY